MAYTFGAGTTNLINCGTAVTKHATVYSLFVRLKVLSANTSLRRIVEYGLTSGSFAVQVYSHFITGTNELHVGFSNGGGGGFNEVVWVTGWTAGSTHTFVVTYSQSGSLDLYADTDATTKATSTPLVNADIDAGQVFSIGNLSGQSDGADCEIQEVGWWPGTVLSGAEAAAMGAGTPPATLPTDYWPLVSDAVALYGGHNGTVTGATVVSHTGTNLYAAAGGSAVPVIMAHSRRRRG